jgi:hypothetical protein
MQTTHLANLVLWSVQGFLAFFFLLVGAPKIIGRGIDRWTGFSDVPRPMVVIIGLAEVSGSVGLVAPMATGVGCQSVHRASTRARAASLPCIQPLPAPSGCVPGAARVASDTTLPPRRLTPQTGLLRV